MLAARRTEGLTGLTKVVGAFRNNANTAKYWQVLQRKQTISIQSDVHMQYLTLSITTVKIPNLITTHKYETYFFPYVFYNAAVCSQRLSLNFMTGRTEASTEKRKKWIEKEDGLD